MVDYPASDLRRPNGLYPHHASSLCAGCGKYVFDDDRAYADWDHLWHSRCWPTVLDQALVDLGALAAWAYDWIMRCHGAPTVDEVDDHAMWDRLHTWVGARGREGPCAPDADRPKGWFGG